MIEANGNILFVALTVPASYFSSLIQLMIRSQSGFSL
jgi:hypothetical protein